MVFAQPAAARGAYVLTEKNFDEEVLQSDDLWIVEFFMLRGVGIASTLLQYTMQRLIKLKLKA